MTDLIGIQEISQHLNVSHTYVRDRLVKRPDFPRPALELSQKNRRWRAEDFQKWIDSQARQLAR